MAMYKESTESKAKICEMRDPFVFDAKESGKTLYDPKVYIETNKRNKISRKCVLCGSKNIVLQGKVIIKSRAIIRGDLSNIQIGKFCIIDEDVVLRPPYKPFRRGFAFFPLQIGNNVMIGKNSIIEAASVGSHVLIGEDCIVAKRCILKDCCMILSGTVLASDTIVPPFSVFAGSPGILVGELPECTATIIDRRCEENFYNFQPEFDKEI